MDIFGDEMLFKGRLAEDLNLPAYTDIAIESVGSSPSVSVVSTRFLAMLFAVGCSMCSIGLAVHDCGLGGAVYRGFRVIGVCERDHGSSGTLEVAFRL